VDLKEIKELIALMKKNDLSVFKMEKEGFKITLKKGVDWQPVAPAPAAVASAPVSAAAPTAAEPAVAASAGPVGRQIVSPMVGTFYRSASPEAAAFVEPGQEVTAETVVCIIEAMKVMNEIKAEVAGTIAEVLVENGKPVEYGQPLFRLK
jgi:acetyl-CoA carboxylase biotin carboxyl carrier protein